MLPLVTNIFKFGVRVVRVRARARAGVGAVVVEVGVGCCGLRLGLMFRKSVRVNFRLMFTLGLP